MSIKDEALEHMCRNREPIHWIPNLMPSLQLRTWYTYVIIVTETVTILQTILCSNAIHLCFIFSFTKTDSNRLNARLARFPDRQRVCSVLLDPIIIGRASLHYFTCCWCCCCCYGVARACTRLEQLRMWFRA